MQGGSRNYLHLQPTLLVVEFLHFRCLHFTSQEQEDSEEESDETIPVNDDMASFEVLSSDDEPEPEEVPAWKTPLPGDAPAEAKDPRFYANVPAVWTQRIQSAGRAVERSEQAGLVLFGYD